MSDTSYKLIFDEDAKTSVAVEEKLDEATGKTDKKYKISGVFSTIGEKNRNGRIYPRNLWETQVQAYQENFANGSINTLMEYKHPARSAVDPMEAVAKITKLYIKDNYVMGEAVLLNNEKANQLKTLIDNNIVISVSSRAVGSVKNGIVENFKLITYDIVPDPSDYNATMNGVVENHKLNEGVIQDLNFEIDNYGNIVNKINETDDTEDDTEVSVDDVQSVISEKFNKIFDSLKYK